MALLLMLAAGCSDGDEGQRETTPEKPRSTQEARSTSEQTRSDEPTQSNDPSRTTPSEIPKTPEPVLGYTYGDPTGNRVVSGKGRLPDATPVDVPLSGTPNWVVGVPLEEDTGWVVAYGDGRVDAFRLDGESREVRPWLTAPDRLPPGAPPAVAVDGERMRLLTIPEGEGSQTTHPVATPAGVLGIGSDGTLLARPGEAPDLPALPDGRIVESADGTMAVLSSPTERYDHGVLGDGLEAEGIGLLKRESGGYALESEIKAESGGVFEGIAPLWFGTEGEQMLAVNESVEGIGSRISVYSADGNLTAAGPFFGEEKKWRHLVAAGPFGPNGETEIVATRTPHIGAVTEFYRSNPESGELEIVATGPGYPTHTIYSRNLDAARAGDLDGDGAWEMLAPNESYNGFVAVRHTKNGVEPVWEIPLDGTLASNIASTTDGEGRAAVAAGTLEGNLRIWR